MPANIRAYGVSVKFKPAFFRLPPAVCDDYSTEIVKYADKYVSLEDREMVICEMRLERVISVLEERDVHALTCGVIENGRYTRKKLEVL